MRARLRDALARLRPRSRAGVDPAGDARRAREAEARRARTEAEASYAHHDHPTSGTGGGPFSV